MKTIKERIREIYLSPQKLTTTGVLRQLRSEGYAFNQAKKALSQMLNSIPSAIKVITPSVT